MNKPTVTVMSANTPYLHDHLATLSEGDLPVWDFCLIEGCRPALKCRETGKWVLFSWDFLAAIADEAMRAGES